MKKSKKITALVLSSMLTIGAFTTLPYNVSAKSIDFDSNNTVYFAKPSDKLLENLNLDFWGDNIKVHAWNESGNLNGDWPGDAATHVEGNIYSYTWYGVFPTGIIINNGDNGVQTQNIDGGYTVPRSDATQARKNPELEYGRVYKATGESVEDSNGNTNIVVAVDGESTYNDFKYRLEDDDTVTILGYDGSNANITIPDEIYGFPVKEISSGAFNNCETLENINVSDNNKACCSVDGVLFNKDKTKLICYPDKKAGAKYSIPDSVVTIGKCAFAGNKSIESIEIPDSVQEICDRAFLSCTKLKDINIPDSVVLIEDGDGAGIFSYCTSLTNITIPNSITTIPWYTFSGCTGLTDVTIPNSVNTIGCGAFSGCTGLKNITIPDSVTEIESNAFADCSGLESINIPDGVTSLDNSVFDGCTALKGIKIPDNVTLIGNYTFANCKSLTSIVIPNSVEKIASGAFSNCDNLKDVTVLNSAAEIVDRAFGDVQDLTIYGYVGSTAETYAKENNIPFVDINSKVLTSKVNNISVKGTFDDGVTLNVEEATVKNAVKAYNITLKDENGNTIQPNGTITVSIPSDNANCKVYWIKEDGTKVDMNATYSNGNYEFTTDHLSIYALIADTTESSSEESNTTSDSNKSNNNGDTNNTDSGKTPSETGKNAVNTGDNNNAVAIATIFAVGALIAAIIMRKKKA
ncbi:MAG: starch-binding protein [Ruminococcaceae bacterium]|nr:starch-binding protein [Oscillospiraceae bacterium]